ncbi:MAG: glycosyltransferase family 39 protein, partial [Nitrospirales bacterium]|nr:glycosyltransferase family 39 protein [Nitrospirales bacterium]
MPDAFRDFCERRTWWVLAAFSLVYILTTCVIASKRMLWNDELFTLYISRLGDLTDIFAALGTGADQNPPSFYWLTHGVLKWLGETQLTVRLLEVIGVLLMSLCLFRFVSRRLPALYGFAAMIFPLITIAYEYAYEARPYGLVLGFSSLALLCWQEATENSKRIWWLIGL